MSDEPYTWSNEFEANRWMATDLAAALRRGAFNYSLDIWIERTGGLLLFKSYSFTVRGPKDKVLALKDWFYELVRANS